MRKIELNRVIENIYNPRDYDQPAQRTRLNRLITSIQEIGLWVPPILYRKKGTNFFAPYDGHRRIRACRELGWAEIPFVWTKDMGHAGAMSDIEALTVLLGGQIENSPYSPSDKARTINKALVATMGKFQVPEPLNKLRETMDKSPGWLRALILDGEVVDTEGTVRKIGWTLVRDIMRYTEDEEEIRGLAWDYLTGKIASQHHLNEVIAERKRAAGAAA